MLYYLDFIRWTGLGDDWHLGVGLQDEAVTAVHHLRVTQVFSVRLPSFLRIEDRLDLWEGTIEDLFPIQINIGHFDADLSVRVLIQI